MFTHGGLRRLGSFELFAHCGQRRLGILGSFNLFAHFGLRRLGRLGDAPIGRSVQLGIEEPLEALLDEHPAVIQRSHDKLAKQNLFLVLLGRCSPKVRGQLSQRADCRMVELFVDGLAGGKSEPELEQRRHDGCRVRGGVGMGHESQIRYGGGGTRFVWSHIGWRFSIIRRGVRNVKERFIIRGRHGHWSTQNLCKLKDLGGIDTK
mmetsp:Transcript_33736/g.76279  ORF Transcript_33736/g.76279 Transcript_33736/m.76279 type:complete len:206 (+) Transcript_33736:856-1473(+)